MQHLYDASPPGLLIALHTALLVWAFSSYAAATVAGLRALHRAYDGPPARPMCLIADATRWLFGLAMSPRNWRPRDFLAFGVFVTVAACMMRCYLLGQVLAEISFSKPPTSHMITSAAIHIVSGSALIVLHCGVALRFKREART